MLIIGLTGGIACGKSTTLQMIREEYPELPVLDLDVISKQQTMKGTATLDQIVAHFGKNILLEDGSLDRKRLGGIIFNDAAQRRVLEGITHTAVFKATAVWLLGHLAWGTPAVVVDAPLLFEAKFDRICGMTVVVAITQDLQLQRLMARDKNGREDAQARIASQMDPELKKKLATVVVDNSGSLQETREAVKRLVARIKQEQKRWRFFSRATLLTAIIAAFIIVAAWYYLH